MNSLVNQYLSQWDLKNPVKLSSTPIGEVYKVTFKDQPCALKLLTEIGVEDELDGVKALQYFDGLGAARLYRSEGPALLIEFLSGPDLASISKNNEDKKATLILCDVIRKLHAPKSVQIPDGLRDLRRRFRSLIGFNRAIAFFTKDEAQLLDDGAKLVLELLSEKAEEVLLHGDIHHSNVLRSEERGWLAIDPKGLIGHRAYDISTIFFNPNIYPDIVKSRDLKYHADVVSDQLGFDSKTVLSWSFCHGCLSASWMKEAGLQTELVFSICARLRKLI